MLHKIASVFIIYFFQTTLSRDQESIFKILKPHALLTRSSLKNLAKSTTYGDFQELLSPILRSRVPGTNGHHIVKTFIIKFFEDINWDVKLDEFDRDTVIGPKRFTNIIVTANPNAKKFLLLTAHYDSKIMKANKIGEEFVAAVDSAVPCAMMMSIAKILDLKKLKKKNDYTLQLVFFDGEEAFKEWTADDSIYGSKHLAEVWSQQNANGEKHLDSVVALILLDLIGGKNPSFWSGFEKTHGLFEHLQRIEKNLKEIKIDGKHVLKSTTTYFNFNPQAFDGQDQTFDIQDDHLPFLAQEVPILHIIPIPFPKQWHKLSDNEENIDKETVLDLLIIFQAFFKEIMNA